MITGTLPLITNRRRRNYRTRKSKSNNWRITSRLTPVCTASNIRRPTKTTRDSRTITIAQRPKHSRRLLSIRRPLNRSQPLLIDEKPTQFEMFDCGEMGTECWRKCSIFLGAGKHNGNDYGRSWKRWPDVCDKWCGKPGRECLKELLSIPQDREPFRAAHRNHRNHSQGEG